jgi:YHS domain-containing protein
VTAPAEAEPPKAEAPAAEPPKGTAAAVKLEDAEIAEIKKLPADEAVLALKQAVCPVSDEHLGAMGAPIKVSAEGKTFYLCCKSCTKEVETNAKAVVAKLAH